MHKQDSLEERASPAQCDATRESPQFSYAIYQEFAGIGGERYLKKLLRQILSISLFRTWEIFVEHQARGNDCYLSVPHLATLADRSLRTMQKNLAEFSAKRLLVEYAERKAFPTSEGGHASRMVVIKDFTNLYALAHEYHEWLHADAYIPPDRIFLTALSQDPLLVAKLRRFNNYRRVLYTHLPGPGPQIHEEDGWSRSYQEESPVPTQTANQETLASAQQSTSTTTPTSSSKDSAREVSKDSPKRKGNESSLWDGFLGDSFDSASSFSIEPLRKRGNSHCNQKHEPASGVTAPPAVSACSALAPGQHTQGARRLTWREREETSQEGLLATRAGSTHAIQPEAQQQPHMKDYPLARSFLEEIAGPFGDRNPKGSTTRVVGIIANASLEQNEVVLCLVRAYTIHQPQFRPCDDFGGMQTRLRSSRVETGVFPRHFQQSFEPVYSWLRPRVEEAWFNINV